MGVITKNISSRELKTSKISLVLRTRENSNVFNTLDKIIFGIHRERKVTKSQRFFFHVKVTNMPSQSQSLPFQPLQLQNV